MAHDGKDQVLFVFYLFHSLSLTTIIMAYNREWDRGKDAAWSNQQSWQGVRPRGEDDHHGDGKRRKYNNGVRIHILANQPHLTLSKAYDISQVREENAYGQGYGHKQAEQHQDYAQDDRFRGAAGFAKKRLAPSEPSPHVIFLGLDPDFTEADVCRLSCLSAIILVTEAPSYPASGLPHV